LNCIHGNKPDPRIPGVLLHLFQPLLTCPLECADVSQIVALAIDEINTRAYLKQAKAALGVVLNDPKDMS
jgi:hypothetical protein